MFRPPTKLAMALGAIGCVTTALVVGTGPSALADAEYHVAYTGIGIYPRSDTSMDSSKIGPALADGTAVDIQCEQIGTDVVNGLGHDSPVWARLGDGAWLPVLYLDTPGRGFTEGIPECDGSSAPSGNIGAEVPWHFDGLNIPNTGSVANQLLNHYYDKSGETAVIDWSYFSSDQHLMSWAQSLPVDVTEYSYASSVQNDGADMKLALGTFSVARTSEHCYAVRDIYDFSPPEYWSQWLDGKTGAAKVFTVRASGCVW